MPPSAVVTGAGDLLELAKRDRKAAGRALDALSPDARLAAVCEAPLARRAELLELMSHPEEVISRLPEAELCFVAKAIGLTDAGWLLGSATPEQVVACVDLDAWSGLEPDLPTLKSWLQVVASTGEEKLLEAAQGLDTELLVLELRSRVRVAMRPAGQEAEDWQAPAGAQTLDGQFHLSARAESDDLSEWMALLDVVFRKDYWLYFRMLQGAVWELDSDLSEWALRWRTGRLEDLGFPSWDEAMRIYGFVRPERRADLPETASSLDVSSWSLPVWLPELPVPVGDRATHAVFRAAGDLEDDERRSFFFAFVGLANRVAVADRMPLGDAETLPAAIEKAAAIASHGLEHVAGERGVGLVETLRRLPLERCFRVGASLQREQEPSGSVA